MLSTGISKKPCIWSACRSTVMILDIPAASINPEISFALIGTRDE